MLSARWRAGLFGLFLGASTFVGAGCATPGAARLARGVLCLQVNPEHAELEVDEVYQGEVRGWRGGCLVVPTGTKRVELRAEGFISQRFDIEVAADEEVTLRLDMEPVLETFDEPG